MITNSTYHSLNRAQVAVFRLADCCARIQEDMSGYYNTAAIEKVPQIEFIFKWLQRHGISICLISDFNHQDTQQILHRLDWSPEVENSYIDAVLIKSNRSCNTLMSEVCNLFSLPDGKAVIGLFDQPALLKAAWDFGFLLSIGLNYGSTQPRILAQSPHHILLDSIVELPNYLTRELAFNYSLKVDNNKNLRANQ